MGKFDKKRKSEMNRTEEYNDNPFDRIFADYDERRRRETEAALKEANINPDLIQSDRYMPHKGQPAENTISHGVNTASYINTEQRRKKNLYSSANQRVQFGSATIIGKREYQQDALATSFVPGEEKYIAVLCDGMGGMNGGEQASALCVDIMINAFNSGVDFVPMFFQENIIEIDDAVASICDEYGNPIGAGSTLISVIIDKDDFYWASVGDSHIYVIRGDEMLRVNTEHNYMLELQRAVSRGEITQEEALSDPKKDALISYMGMGGVYLMDINQKPLKLYKNDIIVLCSDGLYRALSDDEILDTVKRYISSPQLTADVLVDMVQKKDRPHQDNTSVIVVKYQ